MASNDKTPRSSVKKVDHDAIWRKMLGDLQETFTLSNQAAIRAAQAAEAAVEELLSPDARASAGRALDALKINIQRLELEGKDAQLKLEASLKAALTDLEQSRNTAIAAAASEEARQEIQARFLQQTVEAEKTFQGKVEDLFKLYSERSLSLNKETADLIKDLQKSASEQRLAYSSKLDDMIQDLDDLAEQQTTEFEATRKSRDPAEKKKTREQEIKEELKGLQGSLFTRKFIRPMIEGMKERAAERLDSIKEATGIASVSRFLKSERERKSRIEELLFEQQQVLTVGKLKDKLLQEKQLLKDTEENTKDTRKTVKTLGEITSSLRETVTSMRPVTASASSGDDPLNAYANTPGSRTSKPTSYSKIQDRNMVDREVTALEDIARGIKRKKESSLLSTLLGLVAPLAAAALSVLKGLKWPEFKMPEWLKPPKVPEFVKSAASKASGLVSRASQGVVKAAANVGSKVANAGRSLSNFVSGKLGAAKDGMSSFAGRVGDTARAGANLVKGAAQTVASKATGAGRAVMDTAGRVASSVGNGMTRLAKAARSIAGTPAGKFIGKNLNRLGKLATVLSVATGVYEEANGKTVDDPKTLGSILSAIINPMEGGRWLGSKFNKLFQERTGSSFGSYVYDSLGQSEAESEMMSSMGGSKPKQEKASVTPNKASVAPSPSTTSSPSGQSSGSQSRAAPVSKQTASVSPTSAPGAIPNYIGVDTHMAAINMGALL